MISPAEVNDTYPRHSGACSDEHRNQNLEVPCRRCLALELHELRWLRSKDRIVHEGVFSHRVRANELEAKFQDAWKKEQEDNRLAWLLGDGREMGSVSQRDAIVAATVVQWLGSSVGQEFLGKMKGKKNDKR